MSFVKLRNLLTKAFERIDSKHVLQNKLETGLLKEVLEKFITSRDDFEVRQRTLVIYSSSAALKHKIFLSKKKILETLQKETPGVSIKEIIFKGPRR